MVVKFQFRFQMALLIQLELLFKLIEVKLKRNGLV